MLFLSFITLACFNSVVHNPQKTDRERDGLAGPVANVKTELALFDLKDGEWVESERKFLSEQGYDKSGKLVSVEASALSDDPRSSDCRYEFDYDEKGRIIADYCVKGADKKLLVKYSYEQDQNGNWTKRLTSLPDQGGGIRQSVVLYRKIEYFN